MPTREYWLDDHIIVTIWTAPLKQEELRQCFYTLAKMLDEAAQTVHVLFDLSEAGSIPPQAPVLAIRSKFLITDNTGKVSVVSDDVIAKLLAQAATRVTRRDIVFFPTREAAESYLRAEASASRG